MLHSFFLAILYQNRKYSSEKSSFFRYLNFVLIIMLFVQTLNRQKDLFPA